MHSHCIVYFTTKLLCLVYFAHSKGHWGISPCLVDPPQHPLTMSYDSDCWPYLMTLPAGHESTKTTHRSSLTTPLADHRVNQPLKVQLPHRSKWMMKVHGLASLATHSFDHQLLAILTFKTLALLFLPRRGSCLWFMPKAIFFWFVNRIWVQLSLIPQKSLWNFYLQAKIIK